MQGKHEQLLLPPVDVPLFTTDTVKAILRSGTALVCPLCQGKQGRPIPITESLIDETKSVYTACQRMQISYSSGWNLIRTRTNSAKKYCFSGK